MVDPSPIELSVVGDGQQRDLRSLLRLDEGLIHRSLYTDPTVFDLEMERIYGRTWIYVGHESEIAQAGDYKRARIGLEPVIVARDPDGDIRVLVNRCAHRGALVCREDSGNSKYFRCPYHGWTYRSTGELAGAPHRHRYPDGFDVNTLGLTIVPRVAAYRGLIFACFDPDVMPLVDYLGPATRYIDATLDFALEGKLDLSPGASRHRYPGNWKIQMENGVDGYHTQFVHEAFFAIMARSPRPELKFGDHSTDAGWTEALPNGHALLARKPHPDALKSLREHYPEYSDGLIERHGTDGLERIMTHMNLFIFPNLYLIAHHIRVIEPLTVDMTDVTMYAYHLDGAPPELNTRRLREHEAFYPSAGFGTPDDLEVFSTVQEGLGARSVPWVVMKRGMDDEHETDYGSFIGEPTDEGHQRGMFRAYEALMNGGKP